MGDYSPELSAEQFLFRPGASRVCGTIVIYRDNAFEFDEDFAGEVTGLRLAGGTIVNAIPGVTITPTRTEVLIVDDNGKSYVHIIIKFYYSDHLLLFIPACIKSPNLSVELTMYCTCACLELTLGFERELYEFREPIASSSQVREMVCVLVRAGSVGTALIITPMWIPNTATRESKFNKLISLMH